MTPSEPVIEPGGLRLVADEAESEAARMLRYNRSVGDLLREVPGTELRRTLGKIEREVGRWRGQQTDAQTDWVVHRHDRRGTIGAAAAIVAFLSRNTHKG